MKGVSSIIFPVRAPTSLWPPTSSNWYIRYKVTEIFIRIYVCWLTLSVTADPAGFCVEMKSLPLRSLGLIIQLKFFLHLERNLYNTKSFAFFHFSILSFYKEIFIVVPKTRRIIDEKNWNKYEKLRHDCSYWIPLHFNPSMTIVYKHKTTETLIFYFR